jgi:alpha-tubulin suppressor-like RCC1 family protein
MAWGMSYRLGNGSMSSSYQTTPVNSGRSPDGAYIAVSGGTNDTYALDSYGYVWAWGSNLVGGLGDANDVVGGSTYIDSPVPVSLYGGNVIAISGGDDVGYALKSDGTVWDWGYGNYGALGNNSTNNSGTPVQVLNLTNIVAIAGTGSDGYALDNTGRVWAWGAGGYLGNGSTTNALVPIEIANLTNIVAITSGQLTAYALDSSGRVWAWGFGADGELGNGTTPQFQLTPVQVSNLNNIVAIASAGDTGYALDSTGHVWAWGEGGDGQLGNGTTSTYQITPVQVSNLTNVLAIVANGTTCYALKSDGTLWAWGAGYYGQLGNGTTTNSQNTTAQVTQIGWTTTLP